MKEKPKKSYKAKQRGYQLRTALHHAEHTKKMMRKAPSHVLLLKSTGHKKTIEKEVKVETEPEVARVATSVSSSADRYIALVFTCSV